jgi:hypothetical protein
MIEILITFIIGLALIGIWVYQGEKEKNER